MSQDTSSLTSEIVEALLHRDEDEALDFKREQYRFAKASADDKSELLKDILAFANSWRDETAYILLGFTKPLGACASVHGIADHIEDATLQEFVNSKADRTIRLSYQSLEFEGKPIAAIVIPKQIRPFTSRNDYGKVRKGLVYVRRGSSTAIANPAEAMGMRASDTAASIPQLAVSLFDVENRDDFASEHCLSRVVIDVDNELALPDYKPNPYTNHSGLPGINRNYIREYAGWLRTVVAQARINFQVRNDSGAVADDVRIQCEIDGTVNELEVPHE